MAIRTEVAGRLRCEVPTAFDGGNRYCPACGWGASAPAPTDGRSRRRPDSTAYSAAEERDEQHGGRDDEGDDREAERES